MGMYQGELKELSGLFSLLVAQDLELACASKVLYLKAKKSWAQTTISLQQGYSLKLIFLNVLLLGVKSHLWAAMVWKMFKCDFYQDNNVFPLLFCRKHLLLWEVLKRNTILGRKRKPWPTGCIKKRGLIGFSKVKTLPTRGKTKVKVGSDKW